MGSASAGMRMGALEFLDIITPEEASTLVSEPAVVPLFQQLILGSNCTLPCARPHMFLLAFLEANPCPTYILPLFPETINGSR